uniref:Innexin n=1 Tax=Chaetopterus variopedatus TaxID=34590 RepID=Q8T393_CHAVR|nr:innexin [Chaetopterus variopedatus]
MIDSLLSAAGRIGDIKVRCDDDIVDRLNHQYTTFILVIFAIVVSTKQYVGDPIHCWCPAYFTDNHEDFTNKVCWVTNTYYLPYEQRVIPDVHEPRAHISYYQWVPSILLVQALMFYLPCMTWRFLNNRSGVDLNSIVESALMCQNTAFEESRDKTIRYIVRLLDRYFGAQKQRKKGRLARLKDQLGRNAFLVFSKRYGNFIVILYIIVKILYLINVVGQLFLLNAFLGTDYHLYGFQIVDKLIKDENIIVSSRFPRVTMCDFRIRQLGNIHNHTVQCVLPINMFNEVIYIFVWFWLVFVAIVTAVNMILWIFRCAFLIDQVRYVKNHLKALGKLDKKYDKKLLNKFVSDYMRQDGVFAMRLVSKNANNIVVAEVIVGLWENFLTMRPMLGGKEERDSEV